jgi:hypothetical protein
LVLSPCAAKPSWSVTTVRFLVPLILAARSDTGSATHHAGDRPVVIVFRFDHGIVGHALPHAARRALSLHHQQTDAAGTFCARASGA